MLVFGSYDKFGKVLIMSGAHLGNNDIEITSKKPLGMMIEIKGKHFAKCRDNNEIDFY